MRKPCTIQELRQLLDAINYLGDDADWDTLVYQFVTKSDENHELLKRAEKKSLENIIEDNRAELSAEKYSERDIREDSEEYDLDMPSMAEVRGLREVVRNNEEIDLETTYGAIRQTEGTYSALTKLTDEPNDSPEELDWAEVKGEHFSFKDPVPLHKADEVLEELWGEVGEVMLHEPSFTLADMRELHEDYDALKVTKFSKDEVVGKVSNSLDVRWTPDNGLEAIINLKMKHVYEKVFHNILDHKYSTIPEFKERFQYEGTYYSQVNDKWGELKWDSREDEDVPMYDKFLQYAKKHADDIKIDGYNRYFLFDNIAFAFMGKENDRFGMVINGEFDKSLIQYVKEWVPNGVLFLVQKGIPIDHSVNELIEDHGFDFDDSESFVLTKNVGDVMLLRKEDGTLNIGTTLSGGEISKSNIDNAIDTISDAIKEFDAA